MGWDPLGDVARFGMELAALLSPHLLVVLLVSVLLGMVFGILPGLTATLGVALLTPVTFSLTHGAGDADALRFSMAALLGVYVGAIYGGCHPALLLNIPGTAASAATAMEGRAFCEQGRAGEVIGTATVASTLGTITGLLAMLLVIPLLQMLAGNFTSVEKFLLAMFGILICGTLTAPDTPLKGWIAGLLGLLLATVGLDNVQAWPRFTFGLTELEDGIRPIPAILGGFAIPQVIRGLRDPSLRAGFTRVAGVLPAWRDLRRNVWTIVRSGLTGVGVGSIPGVGEDVAAWMSYDVARKTSREPEKFGKGSVEGVIAAETANNACIGGALVPLLTLAIPGSPPAAMLLGALMLNNVIPGPQLSARMPGFMPMMAAVLLLASVVVLGAGLAATRVTLRVLRVPRGVLLPIVAFLTVIGAFAIGSSMLDVAVMAVIGVAAWALEEMGYPIAPMVIALILGRMVDDEIRRALIVHQGSLLPFFTRPVALILLAMIAFSIVSQTPWWKKRRVRASSGP